MEIRPPVVNMATVNVHQPHREIRLQDVAAIGDRHGHTVCGQCPGQFGMHWHIGTLYMVTGSGLQTIAETGLHVICIL